MDIHGKYLVIRHSIREPITDSRDSYRQLLTKDGIQLAEQLGEKISSCSDKFIFFHSHVPRCMQTANSIRDGLTVSLKQTIAIKPFDPLKIFFCRNLEFCAELMNKHEFASKWFANEIPEDYIMPIKEAAELMLSEIVSNISDDTTKIFITHDWNIFCLKSLFYDSYEQMELPDYLEGIIVSSDKKLQRVFKQEHFIKHI